MGVPARTGAAMTDLFTPTPVAETTLVGLALTLPECCPRCSGHSAVVGAGRGPHAAAILCLCGRHLGWMSREGFSFLSETVRRFGRPTSSIQIRRTRGASSTSSDADARRSQPASK
jgi:hypothetical protein